MIKRISLIILMMSCFVFTACNSGNEQTVSETSQTYPNENLLVSSDELSSMLTNEDIFLIDARSDTAEAYIPGAIHFAAIPELGDPTNPIPNYLIGPEAFQEKMRNIGLNQDDNVVILDGGNSLEAARLFYALEYYGFSNASILNGGMAAWQENEYPTSGEPETVFETGNFTVEVQPARFCDYETVVAASSDTNKVVFDVRSEEEYTGEVQRAEKSGHIPNAVHLEWSEVLESDGIPYFKPAGEIQEMYSAAGLTPEKEIIPHCQTNNRGAHAYFTLRLMGYDSVRPYEASWAEYGNRAESMVE